MPMIRASRGVEGGCCGLAWVLCMFEGSVLEAGVGAEVIAFYQKWYDRFYY